MGRNWRSWDDLLQQKLAPNDGDEEGCGEGAQAAHLEVIISEEVLVWLKGGSDLAVCPSMTCYK